MSTRIVILPVAALVAAQAVEAMVYLSIEQAQQLMFAHETLTPLALNPSSAQIAAIERSTGMRFQPGTLRAWRADSGYFFVDAVIGKHDLINYAVALGSDGKIREVEVLEYREAYGGEVRNSRWRAQFVGRRYGDPVQVGRDIQNLSGATLSCQHLTEGIRRVLATYAIVIAGQAPS